MFNFIKDKLKKIYTNVTEKLHTIFLLKSIDQSTILEIEKLLISADTGVTVTKNIIKNLQTAYNSGQLKQGNDVKQLLETKLIEMLPNNEEKQAQIFLLVGINGSGKTTFVGKYISHNRAFIMKTLLFFLKPTLKLFL